MDYCVVVDYWKEESYGTDNSSCCSLLWTVIPLSGQVSIDCNIVYHCQFWIVGRSKATQQILTYYVI